MPISIILGTITGIILLLKIAIPFILEARG
jgi:hypothetical protein